MTVIFVALRFPMINLNIHSSLKLGGILKNQSMNLVKCQYRNCFCPIVTVQWRRESYNAV